MGVRIDNLFLELLEITQTAKFARREEKFATLELLSRKLDSIKFFVTLLWEAQGLSASNYGQLSQKLISVGKQLGKWLQLFKKETPAKAAGAV